LPTQIGDWQSIEDVRLDQESEATLQADSYVYRTYARGSSTLGLFVAFYATQRSGHTVHSPLNCLPGTGWEWTRRERVTLSVAPDHAITINQAVAERYGQQTLVDYWYQNAGDVEPSEYRNKLLLVRNAATRGRSDGALVRVTAPIDRDRGSAVLAQAAAFVQQLYRPLTAHLPE